MAGIGRYCTVPVEVGTDGRSRFCTVPVEVENYIKCFENMLK